MKKDADKQTEKSEKVPQKEISIDKDKPTDEMNKDFFEDDNALIGRKTLDVKNTIEVESKVTVECSEVSIDEVVTEKKVDWESLYMEHVEGNEMRVLDMVDLETLFKEYVLDGDIES